MSGLHGTLGLGPNRNKVPSFVDSMKNLKLIDKKVMSFSINYHNSTTTEQTESYVTFGAVNGNDYKGNMYNHEAVTDNTMNNWWTLPLKGLQYNNKNIFKSQVNYAIIDSGTSFIYLPKTDWDAFNSSISTVEGLSCSTHVKNGADQYCKSFTKTCDELQDSIGTLAIELESVKYTIPAKGFLIENILRAKCVVGISYISDTNDMVILGDTFMRNFYISFEYENSRVGLAVNKNAPYSNIEISLKFGAWYIVAIICLTLLLIGLLACIIYVCLRDRLRRRKERKVMRISGPGKSNQGSNGGINKTDYGTFSEKT